MVEITRIELVSRRFHFGFIRLSNPSIPIGGDDEIWTHNFRRAKATLSQLELRPQYIVGTKRFEHLTSCS